MTARHAGDRKADLLAELEGEHEAFRAALEDVEPALATTPGIVEAWSARDLAAHVAFWSDHGAAALTLASEGRGGEFDYDTNRTDAMNAEVFQAAAALSPGEAAEREAAAYERFHAAVAALIPDRLDLVLGNGHSLEQVIRYDGPDHYAEHTAHLRAWFTGEPEPDDG